MSAVAPQDDCRQGDARERLEETRVGIARRRPAPDDEQRQREQEHGPEHDEEQQGQPGLRPARKRPGFVGKNDSAIRIGRTNTPPTAFAVMGWPGGTRLITTAVSERRASPRRVPSARAAGPPDRLITHDHDDAGGSQEGADHAAEREPLEADRRGQRQGHERGHREHDRAHGHRRAAHAHVKSAVDTT